MAEECGIAERLGEWTIVTVARNTASWGASWTCPVAIGLSPSHVSQPSLVEPVKHALMGHSLCADRIEVEVTEQTLLARLDRKQPTFSSLRSMGVRISLHGFGAGPWSLGLLKRFPVYRIRFAASVAQAVCRDDGSATLMRGVCAAARCFEITVIADGVEAAEHLELKALSECDQAQGNLLGPPLPAVGVPDLLLSRARVHATVRRDHGRTETMRLVRTPEGHGHRGASCETTAADAAA